MQGIFMVFFLLNDPKTANVYKRASGIADIDVKLLSIHNNHMHKKILTKRKRIKLHTYEIMNSNKRYCISFSFDISSIICYPHCRKHLLWYWFINKTIHLKTMNCVCVCVFVSDI